MVFRSRVGVPLCRVVVVGMVVLPTFPVLVLVFPKCFRPCWLPHILGCGFHTLKRGSLFVLHPVFVLLLVVAALLVYVVLLAALLVCAVLLLVVVALRYAVVLLLYASHRAGRAARGGARSQAWHGRARCKAG